MYMLDIGFVTGKKKRESAHMQCHMEIGFHFAMFATVLSLSIDLLCGHMHAGCFFFFPATFGYIIFYRMELLILHALLFSFLFNSFVRFASVKECINITVQTVLYFVLNFLVTHFLAIQNH